MQCAAIRCYTSPASPHPAEKYSHADGDERRFERPASVFPDSNPGANAIYLARQRLEIPPRFARGSGVGQSFRPAGLTARVARLCSSEAPPNRRSCRPLTGLRLLPDLRLHFAACFVGCCGGVRFLDRHLSDAEPSPPCPLCGSCRHPHATGIATSPLRSPGPGGARCVSPCRPASCTTLDRFVIGPSERAAWLASQARRGGLHTAIRLRR